MAVITSDKNWKYYTFSFNSGTRSFEGWVRWPQIVGHSYYPTPSTITWGNGDDIPVTGDFDYDGIIDDIGVYRPSNRMWYFDTTLDGTTDRTAGPWGINGDLPVAGDFDGDGQLQDMGVFRASDRTWHFDYGSNGNTDRRYSPWALTGDVPLAGDFDGDGYSDDLGVFRPSTGEWFFKYQDFHWNAPGMHGYQDVQMPGPGYVNS